MMSTADTDTDTLVALVSSILGEDAPEPHVILNALVERNGDVDSTAQHFNLKLRADKGKKRNSLDAWLKPNKKPRNQRDPSPASKLTNSSGTSTAEPSGSRSKTSPRLRLPVADLMSVLHAPPSAAKVIPRRPPLTLSNPMVVAKHTPCTLHLSVLPPELACKLFYTMINASRHWKRNKWWLFDRLVESPHRTAFYIRNADDEKRWGETAQFWYNGRKSDPPLSFHPEMEEACILIEKLVNNEMKKRQRFPLEWCGSSDGSVVGWKANVAASNCYEGSQEGVGFHSDQLTYLGPYPTIASLSLGTRRNFSLREVVPTDKAEMRKPQTFNIPLAHNSLIIMHAPCQEQFKHSIPPQSTIDLFRPAYPPEGASIIEPSNFRINITFRFFRPDFRPETTPHCKCGCPTALRPDMKNRSDGKTDRYWWTCVAGAQNEGKGCNHWSVMDFQAEGRGIDSG